jgi:hypothetical protein
MHNPFNYLTFSSIVKYFQTETKLFLLSSIHYNTSTTLLKKQTSNRSHANCTRSKRKLQHTQPRIIGFAVVHLQHLPILTFQEHDDS